MKVLIRQHITNAKCQRNRPPQQTSKNKEDVIKKWNWAELQKYINSHLYLLYNWLLSGNNKCSPSGSIYKEVMYQGKKQHLNGKIVLSLDG